MPQARTTEDVVARTRRRRRLEDAEETAEVEFLIVVDEVVADDGAASASAAGEVFDSVMALLDASLDDSTLQAALVGAAEDSGSAALADVEVDVEASQAALEDASYTFSIATRPPTLAPTNDGDDDSLVLGAGLILGAGLVVKVGALVVAFLVLALVVVVIVRCTSTSKRGERPSAAFEMGSAFPMPASPVGAWKGKERDSEMI